MSEVYVVMWDDHHQDTEAYVFSTAEAAVTFARQLVQDNTSNGEVDEELNELMVQAGWLYYGCYSEAEGDSVWVVPCTVDEPNEI